MVMSESDDSKKSASKSVTNREIKAIVLDIGADLVDTLDSIHNAILSTRKELQRLHERIDSIEGEENPSKEPDTSSLSPPKPVDEVEDSQDRYSAYIG